MKKVLLILAATVMTLAPLSTPASARVFVGGFYAPYWGPYWGSYWGPYYGYGYYAPYAGEVKIDTKVKDAQVFINGAYAGTTHENKTMHLRPGSYNIEIKQLDKVAFAQKIYVEAGKTVKIHPEL